MPFVQGFLRFHRRPGRPDNELPGSPGHPDNSLPGIEGPVDPGFGVGIEHPDQGLPPMPGAPDNSLPMPPPGLWPPLTPSHPIVPAPPGTPPGAIWPPIGRPPSYPDQGLPGTPPVPDQGLPGTPPAPDQGLPGHPTTFWVVVGIPGVGWRYAAIDPSLQPTPPMAPTPMPK